VRQIFEGGQKSATTRPTIVSKVERESRRKAESIGSATMQDMVLVYHNEDVEQIGFLSESELQVDLEQPEKVRPSLLISIKDCHS
jgi:hypothetical protein